MESKFMLLVLHKPFSNVIELTALFDVLIFFWKKKVEVN